MALGDGIRRNIASVDPVERALLRDAMIELNRRFFPGTRTDPVPGGVSWWFKQDEVHQATHVHGGPEFVPWHREIVNRLEALLREINPQLSLHYWDWTQDPRAIAGASLGGGATGTLNLFQPDFMGYGGATSAPIGEPWLSAGYYVPGAIPNRDGSDNPADPPEVVRRFVAGAPASAAADDAIVNSPNYPSMRLALENVHNAMHGFVNMGGQHISFRDPFVFLLHSNVDRLFAQWQVQSGHADRLEPMTVYGAESATLAVNVEPWSTGVSTSFGQQHLTRPWFAPESEGAPHTYQHPSIVTPPRYDSWHVGSQWVSVNGAGRLWHTIRFANGAWQPFGDVEGQTGEMGELVTVCCALVGGDLHVCAINAAGRLWHTIRFSNGSWQPFADIESQTGEMGELKGIGCTAIGGALHVCAINAAGRLWHTIRFADTSWQPFGDIETQAGDMGELRDISCAAIGGALHVCSVNAAGRLWHTIRFADASWQAFGDIESQTGDMGELRTAACASVGANLHVCVANAAGKLFHSIRFATGAWQPFGDIESQTGDMGDIMRVACSSAGIQLQVSAINGAGRLWHTIRFANGSWQPFGDIESQTGDMGELTTIASAE